MVGDVNTEEVAKTAQQLLDFAEHTAKTIDRKTKKDSSDVKEIKEAQDVKQGKLNIGFVQMSFTVMKIIMLSKCITEFLADFSLKVIYQCSRKSESCLLCRKSFRKS